jgi:hypothetical protein
MLNTEGLSSDPLALIAFMRNNAASEALYKVLLSLNSACIAARDEIAINQAQVRIVNEQLREAQEQARSKSALLDRLTERLTEIPVLRTLDRRISCDPELFAGDDKNIAHRQETYGTWKPQIGLNFAQDSNIFNTEKRRILHICGLLSGQAYQNNRDLLDAVTRNPDDPSFWEWTTAEAVLAVLDRQYETLDLSLSASISLDKCFQKN